MTHLVSWALAAAILSAVAGCGSRLALDLYRRAAAEADAADLLLPRVVLLVPRG